MTKVTTFLAALALSATSAYAAGGDYGFTSLYNSDYVVLIGFIIFIGILFFFNVPNLLLSMLDKRAEGIRAELAEARELREEAQLLLASYERKQREVTEQAERIVAAAKADAEAGAAKAQEDLKQSIARRLQAAKDQIASAEQKALRAVSDQAVDVAVAAVSRTLEKQLGNKGANGLINKAIDQIDTRLH